MTGNLGGPTKNDIINSLVKAGINAVPIIGGPIGSLISDFIPTEMSKRRDQLLSQLSTDVENLSDKVTNEMLTRPFFISTFMQSFRSAMATEKQEKIDCYRAIILNTLIQQNPDEDSILLMLKITDDLTPVHIKLLRVFLDPTAYLEKNPEIKARMDNVSLGGISMLTNLCFSGYSPDLIKVAMKDLETLGLANGLTGGATMSVSGILSPRLTEFGKLFLGFITI